MTMYEISFFGGFQRVAKFIHVVDDAHGQSLAVSSAAAPPRRTPVVDLSRLELPQAPHLVRWHVLLRNPRIGGVLGDAKVGSDVVCRQPWLRHRRPSCSTPMND